MKKYLLYTDCHFSQYSSIVRSRGAKYSTRLHNLINSISWAEKLADEENCDEVYCLGDFFDRSDLNSEEITALQDVYFSNKPHVFLTGNHDANISNLEFSSMQIFKAFKAEVITEPVRREVTDKVDIYFIPYLINDKLKPFSEFLINNDKKKIVLSHNDLAGIQYGKFISQSGFNVEDIVNNCTLFINGHLHNGGIIRDRIVLIGNLTGQNFNEDASRFEHCAYIMTIDDDGSITLDPHINPYAFNFYKLYINNQSDIDNIATLKNNSVLSISCNSRYISKLTEVLENNDNIVEYRLVTLYNKTSDGVNDIVDFKIEDHLQQFINYAQTKIKPSEVLTDELTKLSKM